MKKDKWFIQPTLIIDREKYRGIGRPAKKDYRIYPDKRDVSESIFKIKSWTLSKDGDYIIKMKGTFDIVGNNIVGSAGTAS